MNNLVELDRLRAIVADYEYKSRKPKWLLRQLGLKLRNFPRELRVRLGRSIAERMNRRKVAQAITQQTSSALKSHASESSGFNARFFQVIPDLHQTILAAIKTDPRSARALSEMQSFMGSDQMHDLVKAATALAPEICMLNGSEAGYLSPWYDADHVIFAKAIAKLPEGPFDHVILVPFGKLGGADFVAGVVADVLSRNGRTLILRTDLSDWDRPDWYPQNVPAIDISQSFEGLPDKSRALYLLLCEIGARSVVNVNSRLAFDMMADYGSQLAVTSKLHAYYFCADRDAHGNEAGYPVQYFAPLLPNLTMAICDSASLTETLIKRYALSEDMQARLRTVYTPTRTALPERPMVELQLESKSDRKRPRILWAGRLDRQKRFDIVVALAKIMPEVQFDCWGKAVLDAPPNLSQLPGNVKIHRSFKDFNDLPLGDCDGWLYTSEWDGLPTTLIELGMLGMPVVASAVGGVPELIDASTGWPVSPEAKVEDYKAALLEMLKDPDERRRRALALQKRVKVQHSLDSYCNALSEV